MKILCLVHFFSFACFVKVITASIPTLDEDVGSFVFSKSIPMPGCDARFAASCSALGVARTVYRTKRALEESTDLAATLLSVSAGTYNEERTFGFYPWVLSVPDLKVVAHGGQDADSTLLRFPTQGKTLVEHLNDTLHIPLDEIHDNILHESNKDGWFKFLWEYQGVAKAHIGYGRLVLNNTFLVMGSYIDQLIPERDNCWTDHSTFCTVHNVRAILGAAISEALGIPTNNEYMMTAARYTYEPDKKAYVGIWERPSNRTDIIPYMFGHPLSRLFDANTFHNDITGGGLTAYLGIAHLFDADYMVREFFRGGSFGGSWVDYPFRTKITQPVFTKVARAIQIRRNNVDYAYFIGFTHRPLPPLSGVQCGVCNQSYASPCSITNVQNLLGYAFVEALRFSTTENEFYDKITTSGLFADQGRFVFVSNLDGTIAAHSGDSGLVGKTFDEMTTSGGFHHPQLTVESLLEATKGGETWYGIPGDGGLLMLTQLTKENTPLLMGSYVPTTPLPVDAACNSKFRGTCSETTVLSIVGYAMSGILKSTSSDNGLIFNDKVLWHAPGRTLGANFDLIVLNNQQSVLYYASSNSGNVTTAVGKQLNTVLREQRGAVSLGSNFVNDLQLASNTIGGNWISAQWLMADQTVQSVNIFAITIEKPSRNFADLRELVTVVSFHYNNPEPPRCGSCGSHHSFCVHEGELNGFCECGYWLEPLWSMNRTTLEIETTTCESRLLEPTMTCIATPQLKNIQVMRLVAVTLFGICALLGGSFLCWTILFRQHTVVKLSQFPFLVLFGVSSLVMASTILFVVIVDDESGPPGLLGTNATANQACMMQVWLFGVGFTLCFTTLFTKMRRVNVLFLDTFKLTGSRKNKSVTNTGVAKVILAILSVEIGILVAWSVMDPLKYIQLSPTKPGSCRSDSAPVFLLLLGCYKIGLLVYGTTVSYRATKISSVLSEGKFVTVAMICTLQILALAAPILVLVSNDPTTSMYTRCGVVFLITLTLQLVIFGPKISYCFVGVPDTKGSVGTDIVLQQQAKVASTNTRVTSGKVYVSNAASSAVSTANEAY